MYARTSFRGAKLGKRYVFWSYWQILKRTWHTNEEKRMQKCILVGANFIPEKYMFFENHFTRMISSLKYKCPPPRSSGAPLSNLSTPGSEVKRYSDWPTKVALSAFSLPKLEQVQALWGMNTFVTRGFNLKYTLETLICPFEESTPTLEEFLCPFLV